jgi:hypothetical protein
MTLPNAECSSDSVFDFAAAGALDELSAPMLGTGYGTKWVALNASIHEKSLAERRVSWQSATPHAMADAIGINHATASWRAFGGQRPSGCQRNRQFVSPVRLVTARSRWIEGGEQW